MAWALPSLLVYGLVHFGHPGYVLTIIPLAYLVCMPMLRLLIRGSGKWLTVPFLTALLAAHAGSFLVTAASVPFPRVLSQAMAPLKRFPFFSSLNLHTLREHDRQIQRLVSRIEQVPPQRSLVIGGWNPAPRPWPWMLDQLGQHFRVLTAVLPDYRVILVPPDDSPVVVSHYNSLTYHPTRIEIPPEIESVFFAVDGFGDHTPKGILIEQDSSDGQGGIRGKLRGPFVYFETRFDVQQDEINVPDGSPERH